MIAESDEANVLVSTPRGVFLITSLGGHRKGSPQRVKMPRRKDGGFQKGDLVLYLAYNFLADLYRLSVPQNVECLKPRDPRGGPPVGLRPAHDILIDRRVPFTRLARIHQRENNRRDDFMKWEYNILYFAPKYLGEYNKLGAAGWEAIAISPAGFLLMKKARTSQVGPSQKRSARKNLIGNPQPTG